MLRNIAVYMASKAVMSILVDGRLDYVTIVETKGNPAHCTNMFKDEPKSQAARKALLDKECLIYYAGIVGEIILENGKLIEYPFRDWKLAKIDMEIFFGANDDEIDRYSGEIISKVIDMFRVPLVQEQIKAVADALMVKQRLAGEKVKEIMKDTAKAQVA